MTRVIKLTDADGHTGHGYRLLRWGKGTTHRPVGFNRRLCNDGYIHAYATREHAAVYDPIHGRFGDSAMWWEAEGVVHEDDGTKVGLRQLTTLHRVEPLRLTTHQRVAIAILCAARVTGVSRWLSWARDWLSGRDRSEAEAWAAAKAAKASEAAAWASRAAAWVEVASAEAWASAEVASARAAAWARAVAFAPLDLPAVVQSVLTTPEARWEELMEVKP